MNQAIEEFVSILKKETDKMEFLLAEAKKVTKDLYVPIMIDGEQTTSFSVKCELENLKKFIEFCKMSQEEINERHIICKYYNGISLYLESVSLSTEKKMNVIFYIIQKNNLSFFQDPDALHEVIDLNEFKKLYAPDMNIFKFEQLIKNIDFNKLGNIPTELLNSEERFIKQKMEEIIEKTHKENHIFMQMHKDIQEHYLNKQTSYNKEDIEIVKNSLEKIGVSPKMCAIILRILSKKLQSVRLTSKPKDKGKEEKYNYSTLAKEASEVMDLNDMKVKHLLSLEEKIYYLSILTRMNVSKEEKRLFLRNCELMGKEKNPILGYLENYNRLKYYENSVGLQNEIAFMEECLQEMMICSKEDYLFWKKSLEDILSQVEHWIPKNFAYEEEEAQRLLSKSVL